MNLSVGTRRRRRVPVITIIFMALAIASPFMLAAILGNDGVPVGWMLVPPALGIIGAVFSALQRSLESNARTGWAVASALTGILTVPAVFLIAMVVEAIDWTVNGPPPWL